MKLPCNLGDHDSGYSIHETNDGHHQEEHPPHPKNEEIFLVEQIVGEYAQIVALVGETRGRADIDDTGHLPQY